MALRKPKFRFKETRINLDTTTPQDTIRVSLCASTSLVRAGLQLPSSSKVVSDEDDHAAFKARVLASASSIYTRQHHTSPKSFLWRILEDGHVLSIQSVDLTREEKQLDFPLILELVFPQKLRPDCITFAESKGHDTLVVLALDEGSLLYSLTLRPDHFRHAAVTEDGLIAGTCQIHSSSAFNFKHPHRLVALSDTVVVAALHDGGIIKFERTKAHQATANHPWTETQYNASSWLHGVRSMLPFGTSHTVKYGKVNMDMAAVVSLVATDLGLEGQQFLVSISIDHHLRIWNLANGQVIDNRDILGVQRDLKEGIGRWTVDPSQTNLLRLLPQGPGNVICLVFSPIGSGEFKFWRLLSEGGSRIRVLDMFEDASFQPSPPTNDIWTLADFSFHTADKGYYVWMLWKNNLSYRVQRAYVQEGVGKSFLNDDITDAAVDSTGEPAEISTSCEPTDPTEKWLGLLFYPGRFTNSTLESALNIYKRGLGIVMNSPSRNSSLAEQICSAVAQTGRLDGGDDGTMQWDKYRQATHKQWTRFHWLVLELDRYRGEALSLVHTTASGFNSGIVTVVCADRVSVIRECVGLEEIYFCMSSSSAELKDVANLVSVGFTFVENLSSGMIQNCYATLRSELFQQQTKTPTESLQFFSDKAGLWRHVTDEDCAQVTDALGPNFEKLTMDTYQKLMDLAMSETEKFKRDVVHPLTPFGRKTIIQAVKETSEVWQRIFFAQLLLLSHVESEYQAEDETIHRRLNVGAVYRAIIEVLRRVQLVRWLCKSELTLPTSKATTRRPSTVSGSSSPPDAGVDSKKGRGEKGMQLTTALEVAVNHTLGLTSSRNTSMCVSPINRAVLGILAHDSDIELAPALIQCSLLRQDRPDLALELQPFADSEPFDTYVQGRVFLALGDYELASRYFSRAAVGMSTPRSGAIHSAGLLNEFECAFLHSGFTRYYIHIATLFDNVYAYRYIFTFSRLALQFGPTPAEHLELLSRMFSSATNMSHYEAAHNILVEMYDLTSRSSQPPSASSTSAPSKYSAPGLGGSKPGNNALVLSCLRRLVTLMCSKQATRELVSLPLAGGFLSEQVDAELAERVRHTSGQDISGGSSYHDVLYAYRIRRGDYRGAASVLYDRICKLKKDENERTPAPEANGGDILDTNITRLYVVLINTLRCVGDGKSGWIMAEYEIEQDEDVNHSAQGIEELMKIGGFADDDVDDRDACDTAIDEDVMNLDNANNSVFPASQTTAGTTPSFSAASIPNTAGVSFSTDRSGDVEMADVSNPHANGATTTVSVSTKLQLGVKQRHTVSFASNVKEAHDDAVSKQKRFVDVDSLVLSKVLGDSQFSRGKTRRKVVTLADIRREYQCELDRIAAIQNNQFDLGTEDEVSLGAVMTGMVGREDEDEEEGDVRRDLGRDLSGDVERGKHDIDGDVMMN